MRVIKQRLIIEWSLCNFEYTIGTSKFAWRGGKHSESAITTARSKMLDKVHRSDMVVQETVENIYEQQFVDVGL